jgi:superfamily I DNA/RNA helicase
MFNNAIMKLVLGPPGTGKTTRGLDIVEDALASGVPPERIAFVSHTVKAAEEARDRAAKKFNLPARRFPYFRTLHSIAFRQLGMRRSDMLGRNDYAKLSNLCGLRIKGYLRGLDMEEEQAVYPGDVALFIEQLSRTRCVPLRDQYMETHEWEITWHMVNHFARVYARYRRDACVCDFTDLLEHGIAEAEPLDVELAIIDEGQDLTQLQWRWAEHVLSRAHNIVVAGDDDQTIYRWSGADLDTFQSLPGEREILQRSHRVPRAIHRVAEGISRQIAHRYSKSWISREEEGSVTMHHSIESVDLSQGSWLLLVRNHFLLKALRNWVRVQGLPFLAPEGSSIHPDELYAIRGWEQLRAGKRIGHATLQSVFRYLRPDYEVERGGKAKVTALTDGVFAAADLAEFGLKVPTSVIWHQALGGIAHTDRLYYVAALRGGEKLTATPRIRISTIHAVKGAEADNVLLMTDVSPRVERNMQVHPDDEHRVFYVGATRARQALHILYPQTKSFYRLVG